MKEPRRLISLSRIFVSCHWATALDRISSTFSLIYASELHRSVSLPPFSALFFAARSAFSFPKIPEWPGTQQNMMWCPLLWSFEVFWYIKSLKNRCSWHVEESAIAFSAFCESQKIVTGMFLTKAVLLAISRASKIAHSFTSTISLFFPKDTLLFFHRPVNLSSQQMAAATWPWSSFDPSFHTTRPGWFFLASSSALFLHLTMTSALNNLSDIIFSTGSTPSAGWIEWSTVICHANHCLYKDGHEFCVYRRVFSGSSPSWKFWLPFLKLIGRMSLAGCIFGSLNNQLVYTRWQ